MFKTFTLTKKEEVHLTKTEGTMTFHLIDENGEARKVSGAIKLDVNLIPISISAERKREHPLIQCLFYTELNETISIEFKQYNDVFERNESELTQQTIENLAKEMQEKPRRVGALLKSTKIKTTEPVH
jgi:hypothetical protein